MKHRAAMKLSALGILMISLILLFSAVAYAENTGTCGTGVTWTLTDEGVLTITGQGKISNTSYLNQGIKIQQVILQDGITEIVSGAFSNCGRIVCSLGSDTARALSEAGYDFHVGEDTRFGLRYTTVDEVEKLTLYSYTDDESTEVQVPEYVTHLKDGVFSWNKVIEEVTLPKGITVIGYGVFEHCEALKSIEIQGDITSIGSYAFNYCVNLESVSLPETANGLTSIGNNAFYNCPGLGSIELPDTVKTVGSGAFSSCSARIVCSLDSDTARALSKAGYDFHVGEDTRFGLRYTTVDEVENAPKRDDQ